MAKTRGPLLISNQDMIDQTDCPWCNAGPGELCYGDYVGNEPMRAFSQTHSARFKDVGTNRVEST